MPIVVRRDTFNRDKALNAILLITKSVDDPSFHTVFKILYFAEQRHLVKYGSLIVGDRYVAMSKGPVPSKIYDILKALRQELGFDVDASHEEKYFAVRNNHYITPVGDFDEDVFSDSELECLRESIEENKHLSFGSRTRKSHDKAWERADENDTISVIDIAEAGGANQETLKYIAEIIQINECF